MRPASPRAPNPHYQDPRAYMARGFFGADGQPRQALHGELAMAMGRELLIRAVPLEVVGAIAQALDRLAASPAPLSERRAWLLERARDPRLQRHPCLVRLLQAGAGAVKKPEDLAALARHVGRVHQLAAFGRALGRAIELEQAAARQRDGRARHVKALRQKRGSQGA